MSKIRRIFSVNIPLAILTILCFIAPDFLAQIFTDNNQAALSGKFILGLSGFTIFLSFISRRMIFVILSIFLTLELIQFCNLFYYGTLITSAKFRLLFGESDEVWLVIKEAIAFLYFVPLLVIVPYGALLFAFLKCEKIRVKSRLAMVPVLLFLAIIPYRVDKAYNGVNYYPDPSDHSLRNTLYAVTNSLYNLANPKTIVDRGYQDYQIESIDDAIKDNVNVILIIGESTSYRHMSLFGYGRDTNPLLSSLKNDPNFIYLPGLSGGVSTPVSLPLLMNNICEPNNMKEIEKKSANLFKLAKEHDFKTFYVSAQSGALLTNLGAEFIDYKLFRNKELLLFDKYQDEALLKIIPKLKYAKQNFIVINQRNAHAPYEENYEHNSKFRYFITDRMNYQQFRIDSYDNAMRYNDYLIYEMIKFFKQKFDGPTYIFFTSDHGEVLDSNKVAFGHADLQEEVAEVPFLAYVNNADLKEIKNLKAPVSHCELGHLITKILGFEIHNPNKKDGVFYIHGTELGGHNEFIEYHK